MSVIALTFSLNVTWGVLSSPKGDLSGIASLFCIRSTNSSSILIPSCSAVFLLIMAWFLSGSSNSLGESPVKFSLIPTTCILLILEFLSGFDARTIFKGLSLFSDKKGQKFFNKALTIYDDPLLKNSPYSHPYDDEGIQAQKKALISDGIISTFITDLKYAEKLKIDPTGNASRGYSSLPSPSFSNIIVKNGKEKYEDIIKSIKKGVLVDQFLGLGQSNTLTGDFSANLDLAFLIENGEIVGRVKDCMITDNLFHLLKEDIVLSKERETNGSTLTPYVYFPSVNFTG